MQFLYVRSLTHIPTVFVGFPLLPGSSVFFNATLHDRTPLQYLWGSLYDRVTLLYDAHPYSFCGVRLWPGHFVFFYRTSLQFLWGMLYDRVWLYFCTLRSMPHSFCGVCSMTGSMCIFLRYSQWPHIPTVFVGFALLWGPPVLFLRYAPCRQPPVACVGLYFWTNGDMFNFNRSRFGGVRFTEYLYTFNNILAHSKLACTVKNAREVII